MRSMVVLHQQNNITFNPTVRFDLNFSKRFLKPSSIKGLIGYNQKSFKIPLNQTLKMLFELMLLFFLDFSILCYFYIFYQFPFRNYDFPSTHCLTISLYPTSFVVCIFFSLESQLSKLYVHSKPRNYDSHESLDDACQIHCRPHRHHCLQLQNSQAVCFFRNTLLCPPQYT